VIALLIVLMQQIEDKLFPYSNQIVQYLQSLWKTTESEDSLHLLHQAIVRAMSKMLQNVISSENAAKSSSLDYVFDFAATLVEQSIRIDLPDSIYLLEDGLILWHDLMLLMPRINERLFTLYRNVDLLLKQSFEYLQILMRIVEDYLLLGQETFLQLYTESMVSSFDTVLGNVKTMGVICTLKPIEIFLQMFPQQAVRCLFDVVLKKLLVSTLIEKEDSFATVHCISIFARILLKDPTLFFSIFQHIASMETTEISMIANDRSALGLLIQFLEVWLEKMDVMPNSRMRKLSALALCNLLPTKEFRILNYLGQIINICISVIHGESSDPSLKDEPEDALDFIDVSSRNTSIGGSGIHAARQLVIGSYRIFIRLNLLHVIFGNSYGSLIRLRIPMCSFG